MTFCAKSFWPLNAARLHGKGGFKQPQLTCANPHTIPPPAAYALTTEGETASEETKDAARGAAEWQASSGKCHPLLLFPVASTPSKQTFQVTEKLFSRFPGSWTQ